MLHGVVSLYTVHIGLNCPAVSELDCHSSFGQHLISKQEKFVRIYYVFYRYMHYGIMALMEQTSNTSLSYTTKYQYAGIIF